MTRENTKRKLAAILSADVKEYSGLMRDDEEATIRTLKDYRSAMDKLVQEYRGRVVDSPGDNVSGRARQRSGRCKLRCRDAARACRT